MVIGEESISLFQECCYWQVDYILVEGYIFISIWCYKMGFMGEINRFRGYSWVISVGCKFWKNWGRVCV